MKKFLFSLLIITASFFGMSTNMIIVKADAVDAACTNAPDSAFCKDKNPTDNPLFGPSGLITKVTQFANVVAGVVAVFVVTYGGLRYVMSSGDPQKLTAARNTILYGVIGIAVVAIAQSIITFILRNIK